MTPPTDLLQAGNALEAVTHDHPSVEVGLYRDGDNNLDEIQSNLLEQARNCTAGDPRVAFFVENATRERANGTFPTTGALHTDEYEICDGRDTPHEKTDAKAMSQRATLADFTAKTLDTAMKNNANSAWLDLVDHGGGDGGAFETGNGAIMNEDDIGQAIADGVARHAAEFPDDAKRKIDGVLFNACLMATCGMESALSKAGVRYLAASPESMVAPGIASSAANVLADNIAAMSDRPSASAQAALGRGLVDNVMSTQYREGPETFSPAAAFDVFNLDKKKIAAMESATKAAFSALAAAANASPDARTEIRSDARECPGMTRDERGVTPWHADRPAESLFSTFANDTSLSDAVRLASAAAEKAIGNTVIAHGESAGFGPFAGVDYSDAAGPTIHFPINAAQIDPWAPQVSETATAFAKAIGSANLDRAIA